MKKMLIILLTTILLTGCFRKKEELGELFHKNIDIVYEYYGNNHSVYDNSWYGQIDFIKQHISKYVNNDNYYNFHCALYYESSPYGFCDLQVAHCNNEEQAIELQSFLNKQYGGLAYSIKDNFVYMETQISYLILYGAPLEKDGYLYFELENGDILLYSDVCNCAIEEKDDVTQTIIPNWVDIIGGTTHIAWSEYHKPTSKELIISEGVKEIKLSAFRYAKFEKVIFPSTIKSINSYAFDCCKNLNKVIIPINVEYIGYHAFTNGIVYCEAKRKPDAWDNNFVSEQAKVYWAEEWEYDENGEPRVK